MEKDKKSTTLLYGGSEEGYLLAQQRAKEDCNRVANGILDIIKAQVSDEHKEKKKRAPE